MAIAQISRPCTTSGRIKTKTDVVYGSFVASCGDFRLKFNATEAKKSCDFIIRFSVPGAINLIFRTYDSPAAEIKNL